MAGQTSYHKGVAAENIVADLYERCGHQTKEKRMKTPFGEIDLVFEKNSQWIFVEVKSSRTFTQAAARITERQIARIYAAAEDYLSKLGLFGLVECRFDAALVDAKGRVKIVENAFL